MFENPNLEQEYRVKDRFAVLETVNSVEGTWSNFRNTVVQASESSLQKRY